MDSLEKSCILFPLVLEEVAVSEVFPKRLLAVGVHLAVHLCLPSGKSRRRNSALSSVLFLPVQRPH